MRKGILARFFNNDIPDAPLNGSIVRIINYNQGTNTSGCPVSRVEIIRYPDSYNLGGYRITKWDCLSSALSPLHNENSGREDDA